MTTNTEHLGVQDTHPSPRPVAGDYNLYVLSTDEHYYLQTNTEEIDLTGLGINTDTNDPTGFLDLDDSAISFVDETGTFTIQPTVTSFDYYIKGKKYTVSSSNNVVIDDAEGIHFIYYDGSTLTAVANPTGSQIETAIKEKALVSIVHWDAENDERILLGDERHGCSMSGETHYFLHNFLGTQYKSGCGLNSLVTEGDGNSNTHIQFGMDAGVIVDEDLTLSRSAVTSTTGLPVYYKSGASGLWRRDLNAGYSILTTGTGRAAWNEDTGSTWQKSEVANNSFTLYHIYATNDIDYPFASIMGQSTYLTKLAAIEAALTEINNLVTTGLAFVEFKPIATLVVQTSNSYTNSQKSRYREIDTDIDFVDWRLTELSPTTIQSVSAHNDTTAKQGGTPGEYYHLTTAEYAALNAFDTEFVQGLKAQYVSATTLRITPGKCRSDDDTFDMVLGSNRDAVITSSGAGGLDTGSEASSTPYYLWLIYNPTTTTYAALLSLSATSPTMPSGYTKKRLVGFSFNNSSSNLHDFKMVGDGRIRYVQYNEHRQNECQLLSAGTATSWTNVDCSDLVPENAVSVNLLCQSYGEGYLRPDNFTGASTGSTYCPETCFVELLMTSTQIIEYEVDAGSMQLDVIGYKMLV